MDNTIRRHEICIVGLPRCDFVFSSTRSCFIAYGFQESPLEMSIIRNLLEARGIEAVEAGGKLAPGENAFCTKICSKIITSQFCIVLLNNEQDAGREIPNANVNMEYGLMLAFNKRVIPFQRATQRLPFNVAGLDTVKYAVADFERLAKSAIDQAILDTQQPSAATAGSAKANEVTEAFLLTQGALVSRIDGDGDRSLYEMGRPLGFALLHDFAALKYMYFADYRAIRIETAIRRLRVLQEVLTGRQASLEARIKMGFLTAEQADLYTDFFHDLRIWLYLNSSDDEVTLVEALADDRFFDRLTVFTPTFVAKALQTLDG